MKTSFDPKNKTWLRKTTDRLPLHDLYFGTPLNRPTAGIPVGDGDTGSLIWLHKDGLHVNIGKSDLWQDAPKGVRPGEDWYNTNNEELHTLNKHGGEIVINFDCPLFDYMYQESFEKRLSLSDATVYFSNSTPFGSMRMKAFASSCKRVSVIDMEISSEEGTAPEITLKRWGSRTLWRWYWQQRFAPEIGLDGTEAFAEDDALYITQDVTTTKFCLGLKIVSKENPISCERKNSHQGKITLPCKSSHSITLYYCIRIADTTEDARKECKKALADAVSSGVESIHTQHKKQWERFWNKSYVELSDDYIENHLYLYLYYMNSASRGSHPIHFIQGPWGFYHDFVPWNYYFHYNMQHLYAPLDTLGHGELADNYYDMRRKGLDAAKLFAKNVKGLGGAFYHDVTDRYGRGADYSGENYSVGAQVAMQLYNHWKYTGDDSFLHSHVLPVMHEIYVFWAEKLRKGEDGLYHIHDTCGYEGTYLLDDTLSDLVMIKVLFSVYKSFAEEKDKEVIEKILSRLPDYTFTEMYRDDDWDGEKMLFGNGKGTVPLENGIVYTIGKRKDGTLQRRHCGSGRDLIPDGECLFPYVEFSPLYPSGLLGLKDKGTKPFNAMINQINLTDIPLHGGMQWNMQTIFLSRLGMGEEMYKAARGMLDTFQAYPNGFNAEESEPACRPPFEAPQWYTPYNTNTNERFTVSSEDFTHFDFETTPVISKAVTESLLQSHEGALRLFPATPDSHNAAFSLFAEGGFIVNAEITEDSLIATIEKTRESECILSLPRRFSRIFCYASRKGEAFVPEEYEEHNGNLFFPSLSEGDMLLVSTVPLEEIETAEKEKSAQNSNFKQCGKAYLGSPQLMHN